MNDRRVGKPMPTVLNGLLRGRLGAPSHRVLLGPGAGLDAAVIDVGGGRVMAIAEDPIFPAPGLDLRLMGEFTVHIGASDVAVTGVRPEFMTYTLLMPGDTSAEIAETLVESISLAAGQLDIAIVGGHTGWYDAVTVPIVGGVTVWGFADSNAWISPGGAKAGDRILMTKAPGVEAAALLYAVYGERLSERIDARLTERLVARLGEISVVADALAVAGIEGVHAMHDATEGGVRGGLWEMQTAAGVSVSADFDSVGVPEDIRRLGEVLRFDPWAVISEGTLLAAVAPDAVKAVSKVWTEHGIPHAELGWFTAPERPSRIRYQGVDHALNEPGEDPFWALFFAGLDGQ